MTDITTLTEAERTETCEVCADRVIFCTCWRCDECAELFPEDEQPYDSVTMFAEPLLETICATCAGF
ncbi:MAG: hypothetical protein RLZZ01_262 [Actinomycetota bacterium]